MGSETFRIVFKCIWLDLEFFKLFGIDLTRCLWFFRQFRKRAGNTLGITRHLVELCASRESDSEVAFETWDIAYEVVKHGYQIAKRMKQSSMKFTCLMQRQNGH